MATSKYIERVTRGESRFYPVDGRLLPGVTSVTAVVAKPALVNWSGKRNRERTTDEAAVLYEQIQASGAPMPGAFFRTSLWARVEKRAFHNEESKAAADLGTLAHKRCEWIRDKRSGIPVGPDPVAVFDDSSLTPAEVDRALWASLAYEDWLDQHGVVPVATEVRVVSRVHGYAGTVDSVDRLTDGTLALCDVKTSSGLWPEMRAQVAAYFHAWNEEHPETPCERAYLLRLPKKMTDPDFEAVEVTDLDRHFTGFLHMLGVWRWANPEHMS